MKLKICGLNDPQNILEVSALLPDYMGFIFWKNSTRYCHAEIPALPETIKKIGVFVDASFDEISTAIEQYQLDGVQLHGNETPEYCRSFKQFPILIIKAFSIDASFDFSVLKSYESVCDFYLFDTKGRLPGGNGVVFNWSQLQNYPSQKPFFLSGGISPEDFDAIKNLNLPIHAIDVNSKFELQPGIKNTTILQQFHNQLKTLP